MLPKFFERRLPNVFPLMVRPGEFGVEIELEGKQIIHRIHGWAEHHEGSLRGEGVEYVTDKPVTREELVMRMSALQSALTKPDRIVEHSVRTSTHIHLNFTRDRLIDALGYVVCFAVIEPLLVRLHAPERDGNLFCMTTYDTGDAAWNFRQTLQQLVKRGVWKTREKYAALNIMPLNSFGTLECRVFPSTIEPATVLQWADLLANLKALVLAEEDYTYLPFINRTRTLPQDLVLKLFGVVPNPEEANRLIQFGCEQAYELAIVLRDVLAAQLKKEQKEGVV